MFGLSAGLIIGAMLTSSPQAGIIQDISEIICGVFQQNDAEFYKRYAVVFTIYFAGELLLLLSGALIYPLPGVLLFFLSYGIGISVVIRSICYIMVNQRLFVYIGLIPVLITAVCCYISLSETLFSSRFKAKGGQISAEIVKNTAVKLFCITAVLALDSLYYCAVTPFFLKIL